MQARNVRAPGPFRGHVLSSPRCFSSTDQGREHVSGLKRLDRGRDARTYAGDAPHQIIHAGARGHPVRRLSPSASGCRSSWSMPASEMTPVFAVLYHAHSLQSIGHDVCASCCGMVGRLYTTLKSEWWMRQYAAEIVARRRYLSRDFCADRQQARGSPLSHHCDAGTSRPMP